MFIAITILLVFAAAIILCGIGWGIILCAFREKDEQQRKDGLVR